MRIDYSILTTDIEFGDTIACDIKDEDSGDLSQEIVTVDTVTDLGHTVVIAGYSHIQGENVKVELSDSDYVDIVGEL